MINAPDGWRLDDFWHNLSRLGANESASLIWAGILLVLLVTGRVLLPKAARSRLNFSFWAVGIYFASGPVRAAILSYGKLTAYRVIDLIASVALAWAVIGVGSLIVFDLAARRVGVPKIFRDVTVTILSIATLVVILSRFGVNLLSLIATSAVLTAVIGLALQDTLGNILSGIALQLESSFSIGDWIKVDERQIGRVVEIGWRSTVIQTRNGDLIVLPNGILTKGVVSIFSKGELQNRRWVHFSVHQRHPPNLVQQVVVDALHEVPNVSPAAPPDCIIWKFSEMAIEYAVRYRLIDFQRDDPTDSDVRKRIWYALKRNDLEVPYQSRNLFITQLDAARDQAKHDAEMQRRLEVIKKVDFFDPLSYDERCHIAEGLQRRVYAAGEVIIRAGAEAHSLYLLDEGVARVKIGVDGREKELAQLKAGEFFGEMSLMTGAPRAATVQAKTDARCYVLDRTLFEDLLHKNPELAKDVGKLLAERQINLKMEREGLSAEVARANVGEQDLVDRIKNFFGLD